MLQQVAQCTHRPELDLFKNYLRAMIRDLRDSQQYLKLPATLARPEPPWLPLPRPLFKPPPSAVVRRAAGDRRRPRTSLRRPGAALLTPWPRPRAKSPHVCSETARRPASPHGFPSRLPRRSVRIGCGPRRCTLDSLCRCKSPRPRGSASSLPRAAAADSCS